MDRVVDRLIVQVGAQVDKRSISQGASAFSALSSAVLAAGAAVAGYTIAQAAAWDETTKTARALGITTEEYTRLTYAADRSGVSQEQLGRGLRSLQSQLAGVAAGSKEAEGNFTRIGVAVRNSDGGLKTAAQLLPEIADAFAAMGEAERMAALPRLLGVSGAALTSLLLEGSEGIGALGDRAEELGIVLSSDAGSAAEGLTDAMTDLLGVFRGAGMAIAGEVMPPLTDMVESLTDVLTASDGLFQIGLDRVARSIGAAFEFANSPMGKFAVGVLAASAAIGTARGAPGLLQAAGSLSPALGGLSTSLVAGAAKFGAYAIAAAAVVLVVDDIIVTAQGGDSAIRGLADAMGVGEEAAATFASAGDMLSEAWGAVPALMTLTEYTISQVGRVLEPVLDMLGPLGEAIKELLGSISLGGAITGIGDHFRDAAEGYSMLARFAAGDMSVQLKEDAGSINTDGLTRSLGTGLLPEMASAGFGQVLQSYDRQRHVDAYRAASEAPIDVSVNVITGSASERARAIGAAVERESRQALSATESL